MEKRKEIERGEGEKENMFNKITFSMEQD